MGHVSLSFSPAHTANIMNSRSGKKVELLTEENQLDVNFMMRVLIISRCPTKRFPSTVLNQFWLRICYTLRIINKYSCLEIAMIIQYGKKCDIR
jgi:hypothetical protein